MAVADAVADGGPNDLMERLAADPAFAAIARAPSFSAELDPARYTGRAARAGRPSFSRSTSTRWSAARPLARGAAAQRSYAYDRSLREHPAPAPLRRGKVREVYEVDADRLLLVASDRVSAFDVVMARAGARQGARC